jgi:hypothetical protein
LLVKKSRRRAAASPINRVSGGDAGWPEDVDAAFRCGRRPQD